MARIVFSRLVWALSLLLLQGLVFNHVLLLGYATPLVYVYILCILPSDTPRYAWLLWGFFTGIAADMFSTTPGVGACSMTLTAMCAPRLLQLFMPKDVVENTVPTYHVPGAWKYITYVVLLVLLQQGAALLLEMFSFCDPMDMLFTYLGSSLLTIVLLLALEKAREGRAIEDRKL